MEHNPRDKPADLTELLGGKATRGARRGSHGFEHRGTREVFGGDELDGVTLTGELPGYGRGDSRVGSTEVVHGVSVMGLHSVNGTCNPSFADKASAPERDLSDSPPSAGGASRRPVDQQGRIHPMTPAPITANVPQSLQPLSTRAPWRTRPMPGTSKATKAAAPLLAMPPPFQILRWTRPLSLSAGMGLSNSSSPPVRSLNDRLTNQPVELQRSTRSFAHLTDLGIASGGPERCYILTTHRTHLPSRSR